MPVQNVTRAAATTPASRTTPKRSTLRGTLSYVPPMMGPGSETPPSGYFLTLKRSLRAGGMSSRSIRLGNLTPAMQAALNARIGQTLSMSGTVSKKSWGGVETVGGVYLELQVARPTFKGTVRYVRPTMAIGGETPPSGYFLDLDRGVTFDGVKAKSLLLEGPSDIQLQALLGRRGTFSGDLRTGRWGGVETRGGSYLVLDVAS